MREWLRNLVDDHGYFLRIYFTTLFAIFGVFCVMVLITT